MLLFGRAHGCSTESPQFSLNGTTKGVQGCLLSKQLVCAYKQQAGFMKSRNNSQQNVSKVLIWRREKRGTFNPEYTGVIL